MVDVDAGDKDLGRVYLEFFEPCIDRDDWLPLLKFMDFHKEVVIGLISISL
jgi:hypothetical protein